VNAVRHDELNLVGVSHPAVCAWSPVVRIIGEHNDGAVGAWPAVSELFNAADVLDAVVRPDVLGVSPWQGERFSSRATKVMTCQTNLASYPSERSSSEAAKTASPGPHGRFPSLVVCCRFGPSALSNRCILFRRVRTAFRL
jgi:hypothetical protein